MIRVGHYGQRSCKPHPKAEHMAAPTNAAKREESSCQLGAVHTWHLADIGAQLSGAIAFDWSEEGVVVTLRMSKARLAN